MKKTKISVIAIGFALVILMASVMPVVAVPMPVPVKGVVQWANGTMVPDGWTVSLENLNETYPEEPWTTTTNSILAPLNYFFSGTADNPSTFVITASDPTGTFTGSETFTANPLETKIVNITVLTLTSITVSPSVATLYAGNTQQFTATAYDQYGNPMAGIIISWTSSNTTVGTIDANGLFTASNAGTTTVMAASGAVNDTASVTVQEAPALTSITVSPSTPTLYVGGTQQFTATAYDQYSNTIAGIVFAWTSSNTTVGTIDANGLFTANATGTTTVNATNGTVNGTALVTVQELVLTSITVTPTTATLYIGGTQQFTAAAYDQNSNVMSGIIFTWTSCTPTVGTIDANGLFTAKATGATTITATNGSKSGTASVTVSRRPSGGAQSTIERTGVTKKSPDGKAAVTIPKGTTAKDAAGKALRRGDMSVTSRTVLPAAEPSGVSYVGKYAYDFGPAGATFNPAIEIAITFDPADFPADTEPKIYTYEAGEWTELDTKVVGNRATAMVTHFSTFVLFAEEVAPTPTPTPTTTPTVTLTIPTPTPTLTPTPTPIEEKPPVKWGLIFGIIIAVIIVGAAAYYFYTKKKA